MKKQMSAFYKKTVKSQDRDSSLTRAASFSSCVLDFFNPPRVYQLDQPGSSNICTTRYSCAYVHRQINIFHCEIFLTK